MNFVDVLLPNYQIIRVPFGTSKRQLAEWLFFNNFDCFYECQIADPQFDKFIPTYLIKEPKTELPPLQKADLSFNELPDESLVEKREN